METSVTCTSRAGLDSVLASFSAGQDRNFSVDFSARVAIVVFLGQRPCLGYGTEPVGIYEFYSNTEKLDPWENLKPFLEEEGVGPREIAPDPSWHAGDGLPALFLVHPVVLRGKCPPWWISIARVKNSPWIILEVKVPYTDYSMDNRHPGVLACGGG